MQIRLWETCKQNNLKFLQNKMKMFRLSWKIVNINFMYVLRKSKPFYIISNLRELPWTVWKFKVWNTILLIENVLYVEESPHLRPETASNLRRRRILIALNYCLFYKIKIFYYETESVFEFNWNIGDWIDICDWAWTHSTGIVSINERFSPPHMLDCLWSINKLIFNLISIW